MIDRWSRGPLLLLWALLLFAALAGSAHGYCRQGSDWLEHSGFCYQWRRDSTNWFKAEMSCRESGGHLASVWSLNENNFLNRLAHCTPAWIGKANINPGSRTSPSSYAWFDGSRQNYTNFGPGNPAHHDYHDCVFSNSDGRWHNYVCQYLIGYVCKAPAVPAVIAQSRRAQMLQSNATQLVGADEPSFYTTFDSETIAVTTAAAIWTSHATTESAVTTEEGSTIATTTASTSRATTQKPTPTSPPPPQCPNGWLQLDNNCYFVSGGKTNYFNAQMSCQAMGTSVASVLTSREHALLMYSLGCNSPTWIGLEKARPCFKQPNKDHCWVWMDRSPVNYFEWASGQSLDRRDAECVILDGQWKVTNCYNQYPYVCKKQASFAKSSS